MFNTFKRRWIYVYVLIFISINNISVVAANVAKSSFYEGTSNHINYFKVALSTPLSVDATVSYQTKNGTALAGSDYITKSGIISIDAGKSSVLIPVEIIGDTTVEGDETFSLLLTNPSGGIFPEGISELSVTHTILNDDIKTSFSETNSNLTNYFLLELGEALSVNASVDYRTRDGTAVAGQDYTTVSGTATIAAGETKTLIAVPILGDSSQENNETFDLVLSNPLGGIFPTDITEVVATHTILNDDFAAVDNTQAIARSLTKTMLAGIPAMLSVQTLLDQPDLLKDPITLTLAFNLNSQTLDCPSSGTFEYTVTDNNADNLYSSAGDNLLITTNACQDGTTSSTGAYNLNISSVNGTITNTAVTLTNLAVNDGTTDSNFNGLLGTETTLTDTGDDVLAITSSNLQLSSAGINYAFSNLSTQVVTEQLSDERKIQTYTSTLTLSNSSNNGTYSTEIVNTLKIHPADSYPYEGKFTIQRQDATMNITVTVNSNTSVTIDTDTSGDNIADYTQTVAWSELSNGF